jgi:hypothetical protein
MPRAPADVLRALLLGLGLALGVHLRVRGIGDLPLFGDEYHTLLSADWGYGAILTSFDSVGSHVALPLLQRLSLDLFGPGVVSFRLVALVPGILTILAAYPLLRAPIGRDAAALATLVLCLSPMHVYYSRFARGYALGVLLALLLGSSLLAFLRTRGRGRVAGVVLVLAAALLPWVHLSTLGFVGALALAGCALAWRTSRRLAGSVALLFALAGVLAFLLFLPVLGEVVRYFQVMEPEDPPRGWFGVPLLIAGGGAAAVLWLAVLPVAALSLWRAGAAGREVLALSLAALAGPLLLLLATNPRGMDYAWARYLLSSLPFLAALVAAGWLAAASRLPRGAGPGAGLLGGALLLAWQLLGGPLAPAHGDPAAFSNTYLALHPLPAFDQPYPGTPGIYRTLGQEPGELRIVETPPIYTRAALLYRSHARVHGQRVIVGWAGEMPRGIQRGPYARILELEPGQADYLILHRDQPTEVRDYFRFVYEQAWPPLRRARDETFMRRQESIYAQNLVGPEVTDGIAARLRERYGAAFHKDERILVWRLAP